jgi:chromate transporter
MFRGRPGAIFGTFFRLGLTSFGGPVAHLGYFHREIVVRRGWLSEEDYAELVGLAQFLPGPASSQVGFAIGLTRGGWWGGLAAWAAFTLPSALAMVVLAFAVDGMTGPFAMHAMHGLKLVAIPVVAQALIDMGRKLAPDLPRRLLAVIATLCMLMAAAPAMQILAILAGAVAGAWLCRDRAALPDGLAGWRPTRRAGAVCLLAFAALFCGLPIAASQSPLAALADVFYRSGALVFGGGHVVLPLLRAELVPRWMGDAPFLAGYGAAQAMPGPLFTLAAYLGALALPHARFAGALVALVALSLPGLLLMAGALPFHARLRRQPAARGAVAGVNAVVVGILAAALYTPLWTTGIADAGDVAVAAIAFGLLVVRRWPPLAVVAATVSASIMRTFIG